MARDFEFIGSDGHAPRTKLATKDTATVIEAGDLVAIASGLIIKATATSTKIAYAPNAAPAGVTTVDVTQGNDFLLRGDAESNFAVTQKAGEYDIAVDGTTGKQTLNQGGTTYKVLMVDFGEDAGVVDAATNINVKINKPIDFPTDVDT